MSMGDKEEFEDIFTMVGSAYDSARRQRNEPELGQFCWVPVLERQARPWVADVVRSAPTEHDSAELDIRYYDATRDFRGKGTRLPVHALSLTDRHELVVSRAKKRLCLIVGRTEGVGSQTLPKGVQRNKALNAFSRQFVLAPLYSESNGAKTTSFGSIMSARIRCLMYPEFFWLPKSGGIISNNSIIRLDHLFVDSLSYGVSPENHFISTEAWAIVMDQIKALLGEEPSDEYKEIREVLIDELPEPFK